MNILLWIFGAVVFIELAVGIGCFIMLCVPTRNGGSKKPKDPVKADRFDVRQRNNAAFLALKPEDVSIQSADGITLRTYYLPADKPTKRFVLLAHGHHANGLNEFTHMTPFYHDTLGYNILLPDHIGHGRSGGKWIGFGALDWPNLHLWVKYLAGRFGEDIEVVLHGISMGAATVMLANGNNPPPQVKLVVEDCGFTSERAVLRTATRMFIGPLEPLALPAQYIGMGLQRLIAGYSAKESDPLAAMKNAKCPMLFVHGGKDTYVATRFVYELHDACPAPKKLFIVPEAIHAYSYYDDPEGYNRVLVEFFTEHLGNAYASEPAAAQ